MNVLLVGPPGSGKGTQGQLLADRLGIEHIAAGDLLRAEVQGQTPLGQQVKAYMERGELVPDHLILDLVTPVVQKAAAANGFVLDGFPRSVRQALEARRYAEESGYGADVAIYLDVPREELVARLLARASTQGRSDDTQEVIEHRLAVFDDATAPLVEYYRQRGLLQVVPALGDPGEITEHILGILEHV